MLGGSQLLAATGTPAAFFPGRVSFPPLFVDFIPMSFQKTLLTQTIRLSLIFCWHVFISPWNIITNMLSIFNNNKI